MPRSRITVRGYASFYTKRAAREHLARVLATRDKKRSRPNMPLRLRSKHEEHFVREVLRSHHPLAQHLLQKRALKDATISELRLTRENGFFLQVKLSNGAALHDVPLKRYAFADERAYLDLRHKAALKALQGHVHQQQKRAAKALRVPVERLRYRNDGTFEAFVRRYEEQTGKSVARFGLVDRCSHAQQAQHTFTAEKVESTLWALASEADVRHFSDFHAEHATFDTQQAKF